MNMLLSRSREREGGNGRNGAELSMLSVKQLLVLMSLEQQRHAKRLTSIESRIRMSGGVLATIVALASLAAPAITAALKGLF